MTFQTKLFRATNTFHLVACGYFRAMIVSIGCDHAGPALKARISEHLTAQGHEMVNRGTDDTDSVDYPDHAHAVADDVASGHAELGILICGSANGVAMTANKHSEVRAGLAWTPEIASLTRQHNNANVLCIPARFVSEEEGLAIVDAFFEASFEGGRHERRVSKICCTVMACLAMVGSVWAQSDVTLDARQMRVHLSVLSSDAFEGRETGEAGQERAAAYLEAYYSSLGFEGCNDGSFFQQVPLKNTQMMGGSLMVGSDTLALVDDFLVYPGLEDTQWKDQPMTFAGHGIQTDGWKDLKKFKEGVLVVLDGAPASLDAEGSDEAYSLRNKRQWAADAGAKALVVIMDDETYDTRKSRMKRWMLRKSTTLNRAKDGQGTNIPTLLVKESQAATWLIGSKTSDWAEAKARTKAFKAHGLESLMACNIDQEIRVYEAANVLAYLEGNHPTLKEELIVITSHYDHVGVTDGVVYNGADDDGSGTVTVMELARQFKALESEGIRPKRSVLFMNVVGEEKGLLGSEFYADNPVFPLENTVSNLNIDMIGRTDEAHQEDPRYVYLIGSDKLSSELHAISEAANEAHVGLALDYTYNAPDDPNRFYYRSDHYNFAKNNIPVIFYFTGVHEDYHQPGDDADKIMYDKTAEIGKLVFHTAWELATRKDRIVVDRVNDFPSDR